MSIKKNIAITLAAVISAGSAWSAAFTAGASLGMPVIAPFADETIDSVPKDGDVNNDGSIDSADASIIAKEYTLLATGLESSLDSRMFKAADVNHDGLIDSNDASIILDYYAYTSTGGLLSLAEKLLEGYDVPPATEPPSAPAPETAPAATQPAVTSKAVPKTTAAAKPPQTKPATTATKALTTIVTEAAVQTETSAAPVTTEPEHIDERVSAIKLRSYEMTLNVRETAKCEYAVLPPAALNTAVRWTVSDKNIATVDYDGWILGMKEGSCTVTVTSLDNPEISETMKLTVVDPDRITDIRVSKPSIKLKAGEGDTTAVTLYPTDAEDRSLIWMSDNVEVAQVDELGWITGIRPGICHVVVASRKNVDVKYYIDVMVYDDAPVTQPPVTEPPTEPVTEPPKTAIPVIGPETAPTEPPVTAPPVTEPPVTTAVPTTAAPPPVTAAPTDVQPPTAEVTVPVTEAPVTTAVPTTSEPAPTTSVTTTVSTAPVPVTTTVPVSTADPYKISGITLSKYELNLNVHEGDISMVTMYPSTAWDRREKWTCSDPTVATVDDEGWVYALKEGTCTVTVTSVNNPEIKAEIKVNVKRVKVEKIELTKYEMVLDPGCGDISIVTMSPYNAPDKSEIWTSSDPSVATVDDEGWVSAKKAGTCIVTVTSKDNPAVKAEIKVTVRSDTVEKIELTDYALEIPVGTGGISYVTMYPTNARNKEEIWTSSDTSIATVDGEGWIIGKKPGKCTVTVTSKDNPKVKAEISVTVTGNGQTEAPPAPVVTPPAETAPPVTGTHQIKVVNGVTYIDDILVVNKSFGLPETFGPGIDASAAAMFTQLAADAQKAGLMITFTSGFRSYAYQDMLYKDYVNQYGQAAADLYTQRAGHSEHQTGLAIDVNTANESFAGTPEALWLEQHAHEYGFIIRYPKGKEAVTGFAAEPWHLRFLGIQTATKVHNSGLTLEEYLGIDSYYH